eukprot:NODE_4815_length_737_cov_19.239344_g4653_i0.p1 GENE.NODE_4815_length_737_cov_19.239344_g4653_i0~~NODE_4815_length_737_cov_19.239344_g4653_i0.p1  ORF type:complete len:188 (-),score=12.61 NODE_4815_length_737_cov_19.239344_g4653_i0:104-667(-)
MSEPDRNEFVLSWLNSTQDYLHLPRLSHISIPSEKNVTFDPLTRTSSGRILKDNQTVWVPEADTTTDQTSVRESTRSSSLSNKSSSRLKQALNFQIAPKPIIKSHPAGAPRKPPTPSSLLQPSDAPVEPEAAIPEPPPPVPTTPPADQSQTTQATSTRLAPNPLFPQTSSRGLYGQGSLPGIPGFGA